MFEEPNENIQPQPSPETPPAEKKLNPFAKWAFWLCLPATVIGIFLFMQFILDYNIIPDFLSTDVVLPITCFVPLIWFVAFILGIIAIFQIAGNRDKFKGIPRSLFSVLMFVIFFIGYYIVASQTPPIALRFMCGMNLGTISKAMALYSQDNNGKLPAASAWCDLLVAYADLPARALVCPGTDDLKGESSYAMNKYVADTNISQLPKDVVVLFETDNGRTEKRGWWKLKRMRANNETYYSNDSHQNPNNNYYPSIERSDKLDKAHWNEVGGPEILSLKHHAGKDWQGCNVLFADGNSVYLPAKDIPNLRWKP